MQERHTMQDTTHSMIRALNDAYWLYCYASTRELKQFAKDALDYWDDRLQKRAIKYRLVNNGTWVVLTIACDE